MSQLSDFKLSLSDRIPSEIMLYAREIAQLEQEIKDLEGLHIFSLDRFNEIKEIYDQFHITNKKFKSLKSDLSTNDKDLLQNFESTFRSYLKKLGYNSYEIESMLIDEATFVPKVKIGSFDKKKRMRADFGSSASDWIRIVTAYTLALHASRSNSAKSNHPNVSIFDEPAQQNMDMFDHLEFYSLVSEVCKKNGGQVIIAATDEAHTVRAKGEELGMNVIDFGSRYILSEQA